MIVKTLSGLVFLDEFYGGVYAGRSVLVCGRAGTGKTTAGFHFVRQGLFQEERCLVLSTIPANDLTILSETLGFSFAVPIDRGELILLEYQSFIPGRALEWKTIPAEGFNQLREIIEANSVSRVVLDTVLPWIAVANVSHLTEQVFSFVRSCDRLGITTMMTMPKPVSSMAFRLKKAVENVTPISVLLSPGEGEDRFIWQTVKYLGEKKPTGMQPYRIQQQKGLVPITASQEHTAHEHVASEQSSSSPRAEKAIRFASKIPAVTDTSPGDRGATATAAEDAGDPARLSGKWRPDL